MVLVAFTTLVSFVFNLRMENICKKMTMGSKTWQRSLFFAAFKRVKRLFCSKCLPWQQYSVNCYVFVAQFPAQRAFLATIRSDNETGGLASLLLPHMQPKYLPPLCWASHLPLDIICWLLCLYLLLGLISGRKWTPLLWTELSQRHERYAISVLFSASFVLDRVLYSIYLGPYVQV